MGRSCRFPLRVVNVHVIIAKTATCSSRCCWVTDIREAAPWNHAYSTHGYVERSGAPSWRFGLFSPQVFPPRTASQGISLLLSRKYVTSHLRFMFFERLLCAPNVRQAATLCTYLLKSNYRRDDLGPNTPFVSSSTRRYRREDLRPLDVDSHRVADLKSPPGNDGCIALHACRFMLLTNKSATVCVISTTCATSKTSTFPSALSDSPSSLVSSPSSPTSTSSRRDGVNMRESGVGGGVGLLGRLDPPESTSQSAPLRGGEVSAASVDTAAADTQHVVHLWCNCRFNNELVRASISRSA